MDIKEIKEKKVKLAADILNLLNKFEQETEVRVHFVDISHAEVMSGYTKVTWVNVDIRL